MATDEKRGMSDAEYVLLDSYAERNAQAVEPSSLVADTPALIQRGGVYLISAVFCLTLLLLYVGKVHVVVNAKGRIIPEGDVRVVTALQGGVVNSVLAHIGDRLPAGAPIARVDVSESGINLALEQKKYELDSAQMRTWQATLASTIRLLANPQGLTEADQGAISSDLAGAFNNVQNALIKLDIARREMERLPEKKQLQSKEIELMKDRIALLEKNQVSELQFLDARTKGLDQRKAQVENVRRLAANQLISPIELSGEEEKFRMAEGDVMTARQRYEQQAIDISNQNLRRAELITKLASTETDAGNAFREAKVAFDQSLSALRQQRDGLQVKIQELESNLEANRRKLQLGQTKMSFAVITNPVAGTIAEIKIRNTGELISAGTAVATVVPEGVPLLVEAEVANKDIGFVKVGQSAQVKVDAYPFETFGTLPAKVITVVPAVGGGNFMVRMRILQDWLEGNGVRVQVFPGLTLKADLLTSKQRLLDLLLADPDKDKEKGKKE